MPPAPRDDVEAEPLLETPGRQLLKAQPGSAEAGLSRLLVVGGVEVQRSSDGNG